jgi:putative spermidine/putrescine transport system ATP-binding protein
MTGESLQTRYSRPRGNPATESAGAAAAGRVAANQENARAPQSISARRLVKAYGTFLALDDISLDVGAGEFLTLLGPSGSGKTTLLNIVAGFLMPDSGALLFGGEDVTLRPVHERGLGMVFQNYALFPHMTVGENVAFSLRVRKLKKDEIRARVLAVLQLVQLGQMIDRGVASLSGGQKQRVALARAVVFSPKIVLMDEPLSALDKSLREQMQIEIRHLHEKIGATTIYVTHDQREALTMSDRVAVMNQGRIVQCDTPEAIYRRPQNAFVAGFIGETTLLPATRCEGGVALTDGSVLRTVQPPPADGDLLVVLRSESVLLPDECNAQTNRFPIVLRDVIYQGDSLLILGEAVGGQRLAIRRPLRGRSSEPLPIAGETLRVGIDPHNTILVEAD